MRVEAHNACEWVELWRITEWKDDCIFKMTNTDFHIKVDAIVSHGYSAISINAKPGTVVDIYESPYS